MGLHDLISVIRRHSDIKGEVGMEDDYVYIHGEGVRKANDEEEGQNEQIPFNLLFQATMTDKEDDDSYIPDTGTIITLGYLADTPIESIRQNFFFPERLPPVFGKIEYNVEYDDDDWGFRNGYIIDENYHSIWEITAKDIWERGHPEQCNLDFTNGLRYFAVAIDSTSIKYLIEGQGSIPTLLLMDIIRDNYNAEFPEDFRSQVSQLDLNLSKGEITRRVREIFAPIIELYEDDAGILERDDAWINNPDSYTIRDRERRRLYSNMEQAGLDPMRQYAFVNN
jgi:hypothetical protein